MKRIVFVLSLVLFTAGAVCAQTATPESRTAAARLLDVLEMDANFDAAMQQAVQMQSGMIDQMDIPEEEKAEAVKAMQNAMNVTLEKFSWENMKGMFADIYAEVFTAEELQGIIEFYESPEGQKFVRKQPQLMQVTMQKMQALMAQIMPEIQKEVEKAMEQVDAEQTDSGM